MGSRWFRIVFSSMVVFAMFLMCRFMSHQPRDVDTTLNASELYSIFQRDIDAALDMYGNNFVTIDGKVCQVIGGEYPTSIVLVGPGDGCDRDGMVECFLSEKRRYKRNDFYESQPIALNGWLDNEQEPGRVTVQNCRVIAF